MTKTLLAAGILAIGIGSAQAADQLTLQLKWVTQAQFAGYYVAKDKGLYEEAGLDVTINPGGPDIAPPQVIAGGGADVIVDWMPSALASREKGVPLVNIAQPFKRSGMMLTCRKDTGITKPGGLPRQDAGRLVLRQRVPVPVLDGQARHPDRRLGRRREGPQAGLQRRPALAEAGRLHLDHDLQRVLAGDRRRHQARGPGRLQVRGPGRRHARGRPLRDRGQPPGPRLRRQDGPLRRGLDEGLGLGAREPRGSRRRSCSRTTPPAPRPRSTRSG